MLKANGLSAQPTAAATGAMTPKPAAKTTMVDFGGMGDSQMAEEQK